MLSFASACRTNWLRFSSKFGFLPLLSYVYAALFFVTMVSAVLDNGSTSTIGALLAISILSIALLSVQGLLRSHQQAALAVAPFIGIIFSIPLIPSLQSVSQCSSCTATTYYGIAGGWLAILVHLTALLSQATRLRSVLSIAAVLAKVALLGQVALLFAEPKFCIFCVISCICMLPLAASMGINDSPVRTFPRFATTFFVVVGLLSVTSRAMFVAPKLETPKSLLGYRIDTLVKGDIGSQRVIVAAASWCHVCGELDALLKKSAITIPIIWECNQNRYSPCHVSTSGFSVFPTFLRISNAGIVVEQYSGLPEISKLKSMVERGISSE